ncbi:MAG: hypothetical protein MZV70_10855 [Desulfobacterales bacterium]|nr:hypothetical protein [Desulfobacterales bacterium]
MQRPRWRPGWRLTRPPRHRRRRARWRVVARAVANATSVVPSAASVSVSAAPAWARHPRRARALPARPARAAAHRGRRRIDSGARHRVGKPARQACRIGAWDGRWPGGADGHQGHATGRPAAHPPPAARMRRARRRPCRHARGCTAGPSPTARDASRVRVTHRPTLRVSRSPDYPPALRAPG